MEHWITQVMEEYGYIGVFLMIALENIFPPIPSEIILPFGGFMTTYTTLSVTGVIVVATAGSLAGAIILYGIGRLLDVRRLETVVERYGHVLRITKEDLRRADDWFDRYGVWAVFFCRMVPLVRSLISVPAGIARMNFTMFLLLTILGTLIWNTVLVSVGAVLGESWRDILSWMDVYSKLIYSLLAILFLAGCVWLFRRHQK